MLKSLLDCTEIQFPPAMQDGLLVLGAVLAHRLDAFLLPRQILLAGPTGHVGVLSFVHGVPQASTVAGVTHAQDRRLRRILLNKAGLPTPPGITFSALGPLSLRRFVWRHGYPLVLKESIGENPALNIDVWTEAELVDGVSRLRIRTEDQLAPARSLMTSAYAETLLGLDEDESGRRIASARMRLLIEKRVSGRYIRCMVCDGKVLAAIERDNSVSQGWTDILELLHHGFKTLAVRAASVIPGLATASVDLIVSSPSSEPDEQVHYIVELSERPRLDSYMGAIEKLGSQLASALLMHQANKSSVSLREPLDHIAVHMCADHLPRPSKVLPLLQDICSNLGISTSMESVDGGEDVLELRLEGGPMAIALVLEALMSGVHFNQRAMAINVYQEPSPKS